MTTTQTLIAVAVVILLIVGFALYYYYYSSPQTQTSTVRVPVNAELDIYNGEIIRCTAQGGIWELENGFKRYYNTPTYNAWGRPPIKTIESANCRAIVAAIPRGEDIPMPLGIKDGDFIQCQDSDLIWKVEGGRKRAVPFEVYTKLGQPNLHKISDSKCLEIVNKMATGAEMTA